MTKKNNISQQVIDKITSQHLRPIPKWEFVLRHWFYWLLFVVCLIILIISLSLSFFGLSTKILDPSILIFIVITFLSLSLFLYRQTKRAYQISLLHSSIVIIGVAIVSGLSIYRLGFTSRLDLQLESVLPYYRSVAPMKINYWSNPSQGRLAGTITKLVDGQTLILQDLQSVYWQIDFSQAIIRGRASLEVGQQIKILGKVGSLNTFIATDIRPWQGMGQGKVK